MVLSVFEVFKIGIGPSSSHTMGPMNAAADFVRALKEKDLIAQVAQVKVELYGSLAFTGKGHGTDRALIMGLENNRPHEIDPEYMERRLEEVLSTKALKLAGTCNISFELQDCISFNRKKVLPRHSNGMIFKASAQDQKELFSQTSYSLGGGFIFTEGLDSATDSSGKTPLPFVFKSAKELLAICKSEEKSIAQITLSNELHLRTKAEVEKGLGAIWLTMQRCIERGCAKKGLLPGKLKVRRRAFEAHQRLLSLNDQKDPLQTMDWVNLYALAVNEENAAGGKIVTAPTNGAAGIIPAVLKFFETFRRKPDEPSRSHEFLLTAAAIASLYTENASISGAEVGCQGEVGVACSMAAGALAAVLGGSVEQVEQAAEIGMEHNLGLTCDPIGGLVQIPCIERNAMGAIKAINAARLALQGDGKHHVSLDDVIATMRQTGADMLTKYKETSRGGLAVNVTEC